MIKQHLHLALLAFTFCASNSWCEEKKETPPVDKRTSHDKMLSLLTEKSKINNNERKIAQDNLSALHANKKFYLFASILTAPIAAAGGVGSYLIFSTKTAIENANQPKFQYAQRFTDFATRIPFISPENIETGTYAGTAFFALIAICCTWRLIANWSSQTAEEGNCLRAIERSATCNEILAELYDLVYPRPIAPTDKKDEKQTQAPAAAQPTDQPTQMPSVTVQVPLLVNNTGV